MLRYYTPSLFIFSTLGGIVTFMLVSGDADLPTSVLFSAITTLVIATIIPALFAIGDRKFNPLRKEIKDKIILDERVNFVVGEEIRQGFMVTTKSSMFVLSTEGKKAIKFEIKKSDIKKISISEGVFLNIFLDYDKCIRVFAGNCDELVKKLNAEGFGK